MYMFHCVTRCLRSYPYHLSYSTRQNIIYYETYKTIIDQLLANGQHTRIYVPGKLSSN